MPAFTPKIDVAYREYADGQLRRHALLSEGKGESDEANDIEERLAVLWESLDDTQRLSLNGMASDLNWLRRRGVPPPRGRAACEVTPAELRELKVAEDARDWHAILHHLRFCAAAIPQDLLAYRRATCYQTLGYPTIGTAFADLAAELSRGNGQVGRPVFDVQPASPNNPTGTKPRG